MRSAPLKLPFKNKQQRIKMRTAPTKKKPMAAIANDILHIADTKTNNRDTISETITMVVKGKSTKSSVRQKKSDNKTNAEGQIQKSKKINKKVTNLKQMNVKKKEIKRNAKKLMDQANLTKSKEPEKSPKSSNIPKSKFTQRNNLKKDVKDTSKPVQIVNKSEESPKLKNTKTRSKSEENKDQTSASSKKQPKPKIIKESKKKELKSSNKIKTVDKKALEITSEFNKNTISDEKVKSEKSIVEHLNKSNLDDKKAQETIQKLLQEANKVLETSTKKKKKFPKKDIKKVSPKDKNKVKVKKLLKAKIEIPEKPKEIPGKGKMSKDVKDINKTKETTKDQTKDSKEKQEKVSKESPKDKLPTKIKEESLFESDSDNMSLKDLKMAKKNKVNSKSKLIPVNQRNKPNQKKVVTIKKRPLISQSSKDNSLNKSRKSKVGLINGPKRHRVASLNALAKVHCLYENETRNNLLDSIETSTTVKKEQTFISKQINSTRNEITSSIASTRTLRSVPGLRAIGKHWDMHDTTSSSEDNNSDSDSGTESKPQGKSKKELILKKVSEDRKPIKKRQRKCTELIMDLKDMVVRKRMASLNATAILAASYSVEKRAGMKSPKTDDSYDSDSSDDYFRATDTEDTKKKKKCYEDDVKKEEERNVIEVHTTPNKKVAVILNQDTDVTITGVYVNSTTRSTHQDGYCSIAGMQYRISATSHTQTNATAVATETLLHSSSSSTSTTENGNSSDSTISKSYTPLDALSNMQPPPGPGIQHHQQAHAGNGALHHMHHHHHHHPGVMHGPPPPTIAQHHMGPPMPPHQLSPAGRRHGCASAFSSPHAMSHNYATAPPGHHLPPPGQPPMQPDMHYLHQGYYQPAGPLITVSHGHGQAPLPTKSAPLSEPSPNSTNSPAPHNQPPSSANGDSSDSEVIITSVTTSKEAAAAAAAAAASSQPIPSGYRCSQYPSGPPPAPPTAAGYPYYSPYHYNPQPPPTPSFAHHDLYCIPPPPPNLHHKYTPTPMRRYITGPSYYSSNPPPPQEMYSLPPTGPSQQQLVTTTPVPASGTTFQPVPNGPPPPTLIESYLPPPAPTLVDSYQHQPPPPPTGPPPPHCYPAYGPPPQCFTHSAGRPLQYLNTPYQTCTCPMQSCPKNVLTGPLTGDSKRPNISTIIKDNTVPLPPVALALPLEPASAIGPPSPARGSAGMPPPPSPAGATYQQPPPAPVPKQESRSPDVADNAEEGLPQQEVKRKARIGKEAVRNTMLLMCNPQNTTYTGTVKREIESPEQKKKDLLDDMIVQEKTEIKENLAELKCQDAEIKNQSISIENIVNNSEKETAVVVAPLTVELSANSSKTSEEEPTSVLTTVAESVKVKNMKRKMSMNKEKEAEHNPPPSKKPKMGSYKDFIKKKAKKVQLNNNNNNNNNVRKKIVGPKSGRKSNIKIKLKTGVKRKLKDTKGGEPSSSTSLSSSPSTKRIKLSKPESKALTANNLHKQSNKVKDKVDPASAAETTVAEPQPEPAAINNNSLAKVATCATSSVPQNKKKLKSKSPCSRSDKSASSNIDRIIESVINEYVKTEPANSSLLSSSSLSLISSKELESTPCSSSSIPCLSTPSTSSPAVSGKESARKVTVSNAIITTNRKSTNITPKSNCSKTKNSILNIKNNINKNCNINNNNTDNKNNNVINSKCDSTISKTSTNNNKTNNKNNIITKSSNINKNNNKNSIKSTLKKNVKSKIPNQECGKKVNSASTSAIASVASTSTSVVTLAPKKKSKAKDVVPQTVSRVPRRSIQQPRWSNGWRWEGESYDAKVFLNSDETTVIRKCYPAMRHSEGDLIEIRDCVLLKAGPKKNDLPYVAKIAALWENPEDGEMMMSLLWYYRPEHTEQGRLPTDQPDEVFASRHKDSNSVACIDDKCYVLTFNEYCRYRKSCKLVEEGLDRCPQECIPIPEPYPRSHRLPPAPLQISQDMVFFCRRVYDFRQKRIVKNPT